MEKALDAAPSMAILMLVLKDNRRVRPTALRSSIRIIIFIRRRVSHGRFHIRAGFVRASGE
jgi:hypothetical protein